MTNLPEQIARARDEAAEVHASRDGLTDPAKFYSYCAGWDACISFLKGQTEDKIKALEAEDQRNVARIHLQSKTMADLEAALLKCEGEKALLTGKIAGMEEGLRIRGIIK